jgi:5-methylcytosine-specific restriction protein A
MPQRAAHPCRFPGCVQLVRDGGYCLQHAREVQQRTDAERGNSAARGYGATWRRLRRMFLDANPICVDPFGSHGASVVLATDVDHIVPRPAGGNEWQNLQALCHSCHSRKTLAESVPRPG